MRLAVALALLAAAAGAAAATGPNPITQPPLDGCTRNPAALLQGLAPSLVYVNRSAQPQALAGIVDAVAPAADLRIAVTPDASSAFLPAAGATGIQAVRDSATVPAFAWPEPGDRVQLSGSWVWNCAKWKPAGERTELHPFRTLWEQRATAASSPWGETEGDLFASTDATEAGVVADCALQPSYTTCLATQPQWQDVSGTYRFVLPAPPKPTGAGALRVRLVDRGSSGGAPPTVAMRAGVAVVTMRLAVAPGAPLAVARQVFLGWTKVPASELPQHLHVSFRSPLDPTTCDVAGVWGLCSTSRPIDVYVPRGTPWRVAVYAQAGTITHRFASPVAALGLHRDRSKGYALTYVITRVNDALKRAAAQPR